ncbi:hypothetical protein [Virgibacillus alimentarius]|uniref:Uncharacterized protein n=1 Tax=Virgibacillus alimentarius TaxID=698769 RepID=A0ABS4S9H5_9BACI|nr:hypothetical protein [Virgibacillus alimentarius]MBP2257731.1 hypothetical protein [Virgibacillus alimentarius]
MIFLDGRFDWNGRCCFSGESRATGRYSRAIREVGRAITRASRATRGATRAIKQESRATATCSTTALPSKEHLLRESVGFLRMQKTFLLMKGEGDFLLKAENGVDGGDLP